MFTSNLALAIREIRKNLFRSLLTILGVVIGVAAVITIVTLGNGATAKITESFSGLGANILMIHPGMERRGPPGPGMRGMGRPFTMTDVDEMREIPGIRDVAPMQPKPMLAKTEFTQRPVPSTATTPDYLSLLQLDIEFGDTFSVGEEDNSLEVILGSRSAKELFDPKTKNVVGKSLELNGTPYRVVGVLKKRERGAFGFDHNGSILVQIDGTEVDDERSLEVAAIFLTVDDVEQMASVKEKVTKLLRENRELPKEQKSDFQIRGIEQIVNAILQATAIVTTVIGLIAAISLLVGGIGIMNVMLVTVTERTREIGVRIAIGAEPRDVMLQFIVEACMLTAFGGLVGIALGLGAGAIASHFIELPFQPSSRIIVLVFLFSIFMGVLFGFLPARRASKVNPIDALRHE